MLSIRLSEAKENRVKFCLFGLHKMFSFEQLYSSYLSKARQLNLINIVTALLRSSPTLEIQCNPNDQATTLLPNSVVLTGRQYYKESDEMSFTSGPSGQEKWKHIYLELQRSAHNSHNTQSQNLTETLKLICIFFGKSAIDNTVLSKLVAVRLQVISF